MRNYYYLFLAAIFFLPSCKTSEVYKAHYKETETQPIVEQHVIQTPVIADLDVNDKKVSGTYTGDNVQVSFAKNKALEDAIAKAGCDVLVEPLYEVDVNGKTVTATVQGYPGKYKNFRKPQAQDSVLLQWRNTVKAPVEIRTEKPKYDDRMLTYDPTKCESMRATGTILTYTGTALLVTGSALVIGGSYYSKNGGEDHATIPMIAMGGVLTAAGVFLVPFGVTLNKKGKLCSKFGNTQGARIDFNPQLNMAQNRYGMGVAIQF